MKTITEITEILTGSPVFLIIIGIWAILNLIYILRSIKMEKKNNIMQIRVTEEELKYIDRLGNYWNMTRSGIVRRAIQEKWINDQKYVKDYEKFQEYESDK